MAISWASKRKLIYAIIASVVFILLIIIPAFLIFYKAPTCFDLKKNGGETGVDCGGKCTRLCQDAFLPPRIQWGGAKIEKLTEGLYNVASYIVNPNINGGAIGVPYKISLYDSQGVYITEKTGKVDLYPRRNSLAFQTAVNTEKRIPAKATFEFTSPPEWFKSSDELGGITIMDKNYEEEGNSSSLRITLGNKTLTPYRNVQVSAVLYDRDGNTIGFSQTTVDYIGPKNPRESQTGEVASYTWSNTRNNAVTSIEVIPSIKPVPIQ